MADKHLPESGSAVEVFAALTSYHRILISGHLNPDGDAVGSVVAMARILTQRGHIATTAIDPITVGAPKFLLDHAPRQISSSELKAEDYDALLILDCGNVGRTPQAFQAIAQQLPVITIDHHVFSQKPTLPHWIDPHASSAGEMVYAVAQAAQCAIDVQTAECLWVAIITDTGRFAYASTYPSTLRMAAHLLEIGIDTASINDQIYLFSSQPAMEMNRRAYESLTLYCDDRIAMVHLSLQDFLDTGVKKADLESVIDIPRAIASAGIALFLYETPSKVGVTSVSIRTRPPYDATQIATHFGGGGHIRAAGCDIPGPADVAITTISDYLTTLLA